MVSLLREMLAHLLYDFANRMGAGVCRARFKFKSEGCAMISIPSKAALTVLLFLTFSAAGSRAQMAIEPGRGHRRH